MKPNKIPCDTHLVLEALKGRDDFMNLTMLVEETGLIRNKVRMACAHLTHYKAAEVISVGDELWFMPTPESDTRMRVLVEIKDGITRNKRRPTKTILSTHGVDPGS